MNRIIFHIDQNCYFASVEMIYHPECRYVPMAVVGDRESRHGIVLAKNEKAKHCGVSTAEAIWQAKAKCPDLVTLPAHHEKYVFYSGRLRAMYGEYTDRVEPFGLDECWLDMTGIVSDYDEAEALASTIRRRVRDEFRLTCSVGISFNKVFAKLGSDYRKPDATTVFREDSWKDIVWGLPAEDMLYVGKRTSAMLKKINVRTIGELAGCNSDYIVQYLGRQGIMLWRYANGLDDSPVAAASASREIKSVGNSTTTAVDMTSNAAIEKTMHMLAGSVASRLRAHGLRGTVIQITVRDRDLHIYEHQRILYEPTDSERIIYDNAMELFKESYDWSKGVRSVGVRCSKVIEASSGVQLSMFSDEKARTRDETIGKLMDSINKRYGPGVIKSAAEVRGNITDGNNHEGCRFSAPEDPFHPKEDELMI